MSKQRWTSRKPTKGGWYWLKSAGEPVERAKVTLLWPDRYWNETCHRSVKPLTPPPDDKERRK